MLPGVSTVSSRVSRAGTLGVRTRSAGLSCCESRRCVSSAGLGRARSAARADGTTQRNNATDEHGRQPTNHCDSSVSDWIVALCTPCEGGCVACGSRELPVPRLRPSREPRACMSSSSRRRDLSREHRPLRGQLLTAVAPRSRRPRPRPAQARSFTLSLAQARPQRFCATRSVTGAGVGPAALCRSGRRLRDRPLSGGSESQRLGPRGRRRDDGQGAQRLGRHGVHGDRDDRRPQGPGARCPELPPRRAPHDRSAQRPVDQGRLVARSAKDQAGPAGRPCRVEAQEPRRRARVARARHADHPAGPTRTSSSTPTPSRRGCARPASTSPSRESRRARQGPRATARPSGAPARTRAPRRPRATPAGRTSYRTLPEDRAGAAAARCRRTPASSGSSCCRAGPIEGREILGIEIAEDVDTHGRRPADLREPGHASRPRVALQRGDAGVGLDLIDGYQRGRAAVVERSCSDARTFVIPCSTSTASTRRSTPSATTPTDPTGRPGTSGFEQAVRRRAPTSARTARPAIRSTERQPCILRTRRRPSGPPPAGRRPTLGLPATAASTSTATTASTGAARARSTRASARTRPSSPSASPHGPGAVLRAGDRRRSASGRAIATCRVLISNHTFTGLILRPPGTSVDGPARDELRLQRARRRHGRARPTTSPSTATSSTTRPARLDDYIVRRPRRRSPTRRRSARTNFHPNYVTGFMPEYDGRPTRIRTPAPPRATASAAGCARPTCWPPRPRPDADSHSVTPRHRARGAGRCG